MPTLLIDGKWVAATGGQTIDVINPCDAIAYATIDRGTAADIDLAVKAAQRAMNGTWGNLTATERGRILVKAGELILKNSEEIAQIESRDTGKPVSVARADVVAVARYFEYFGGAADKHHGEQIPYLNGYNVQVVRVPHGVAGLIIPWNYPAQMFGRTVAPALAAGNACVLKPSEDACMSGLKLAELMVEAGLPPGALNLITGYGYEAGSALTSHADINFVSFTGSPEVGVMVQEATAKNSVACALELGGKSPQIVFNDADLDKALPIIVKAITQNAGQTCSAGSRLLIQHDIYDVFVARVAEAFKKVRVGTPEMDFDCGPIVNKKQFDRVTHFIDDAVKSGVPLLAQGIVADGVSKDGYFVAPALFGAVPRDHRLACKEVFGPVLAAMPFNDEDDAVHLANATEYGLVSGIWTENGGRQQRMAKRMQSGQVFINCYGAGGGVELPFGGMKRSGHGREKGFVALEEFSTLKTVVQYHG
ncbi:MAG: aldehyde dehydrogenase family protein [Oxalobacteraceae bacterium]|jgi:aldehyde dehydrogenase (NAD+)|nr:aldehyde dehydrogenase family protein [Oxalobacteraceae bacterium]